MFPSFLHCIACLHELPLPSIPPSSTWFLFFSWFLEVLRDTLILWLNITSVFKLTVFSLKKVSASLSGHIQFRSCGIQVKKLPFYIFVEHFLKTKETSFSFSSGCNPYTFFWSTVFQITLFLNIRQKEIPGICFSYYLCQWTE